MTQPARRRYTHAEYLRLEAFSNVKHEFCGGEIHAMAGGTIDHGALAASAIALLRTQLGARPCRAFSSDLRVRVLATGLATYPDVSVACGPVERDPDDRHAVTNPIVIVEVLSESTADYDRGEKFEHYRHRAPDATWATDSAGPGQRVSVPSLDLTLAADDI